MLVRQAQSIICVFYPILYVLGIIQFALLISQASRISGSLFTVNLIAFIAFFVAAIAQAIVSSFLGDANIAIFGGICAIILGSIIAQTSVSHKDNINAHHAWVVLLCLQIFCFACILPSYLYIAYEMLVLI